MSIALLGLSLLAPAAAQDAGDGVAAVELHEPAPTAAAPAAPLRAKDVRIDALPRELTVQNGKLWVDGVRMKGGAGGYFDAVVKHSDAHEAQRLKKRQQSQVGVSCAASAAVAWLPAVGVTLGFVELGVFVGAQVGLLGTAPRNKKIAEAYNAWAAEQTGEALEEAGPGAWRPRDIRREAKERRSGS